MNHTVNNDQTAIDSCLKRIRNARNVGAEKKDIVESLSKDYSMDIIFLCWHGACLMDGGNH